MLVGGIAIAVSNLVSHLGHSANCLDIIGNGSLNYIVVGTSAVITGVYYATTNSVRYQFTIPDSVVYAAEIMAEPGFALGIAISAVLTTAIKVVYANYNNRNLLMVFTVYHAIVCTTSILVCRFAAD